MNAVATEERPRTAQPAEQLFEPAGSTLEDLVLGAWEDLAVDGRAECPVCRATLRQAGCDACGSRLS